MREPIRQALAVGPDVLMRSASSRYNCMGMVFGSRRTAIDTDQWDLIRQDDEYRLLRPGEAPVLGDLVVYRKGGRVVHVGMVAEVRLTLNGTPSVTILSQWGFSGEYRHPVNQVPPGFGAAVEYWTERVPRS
jgi:hypothetical protein